LVSYPSSLPSTLPYLQKPREQSSASSLSRQQTSAYSNENNDNTTQLTIASYVPFQTAELNSNVRLLEQQQKEQQDLQRKMVETQQKMSFIEV
jgi:hypothetical protein